MDTTVNAVTPGRGDQAGGLGRTMTRLAVAGLLAALLLGMMSSVVDARKVTTTLGQQDFVNQCRNGGGTPKRIRTHVVQCTTADGTVVTCDFNTSPASCTIPFKPSAGSLVFPVDGALLDLSPAEPTGPKAGGVVVAPATGVLVQAEATPTPEPQTGQPVVTEVTVVTDVVEVAGEEAVLAQDAAVDGASLVESDEEKP